MNNLLIIGFDGIDGSGKTSLISKLMSNKKLEGICVYTKCGNPPSSYSKKMYSILHTFKESFNPLELFVEDLLFRYSQMPIDKIILSDRTFISASVFYKSTSELMCKKNDELNKKITFYSQIYEPCLSIILLANIETARKRISQSGRDFKSVEEIPFQNLCNMYFSQIKPSKKNLIINTLNFNKGEIYNMVKTKIIKLNLNPQR